MQIQTPCIIIEKEKLIKNIEKISLVGKNNNCNVRPHIKTHKIPAIAKMQLEAGAIGITVAKVSEAEIFSQNGINDIFIAYPVIGESKILRVLELNKTNRIIVGIDSLFGAVQLSKLAVEAKQIVEIRVEIDTGLRRTGISYDLAIETIKEILKLPNLKLNGIYTFRGLILDGKPTLDREKAGIQEGQLMVELKTKLENQGIEVNEVSVGSTPTNESVAKVKGITEIRPGTYVFYDNMQYKMGCCGIEECAAYVLVTVISNPYSDLAIVDGGSKTFSTDFTLNSYPCYFDSYGYILEKNTDILLERVNEEHGMLKLKNDLKLSIGEKLKIIPNHICSTINLHNFVYLKDGDTYEKLDVEARGKLY